MKQINLFISFPKISTHSKRLGGTAYQNWIFVIVFPFLVQKYIQNRDDQVCKMFVSLLQVCQLSCYHKISENQLRLISVHINEYLELRMLCFSNINMRPKHHYMTHYPYLMRQCGPLIKLWTMRFENKHQFFKRIANRCKIFINITKLLSERHQLHQSSLYLDRFPNDITSEKIFPLIPSMYTINFQHDYKFFSKSIDIKGITYKENSCVVLRTDIDFNVIVLKISEFFIKENYKNVLFYGVTTSFWFNYKIGIYESISEDFQNLECVDFTNLLEPIPIFLLKIKNKIYFSTKNALDVNIM